MTYVYAAGLNALKAVVEIDEAHYPEIMRKFYVVNTPRIFTMFWKLVSPWMDKKTVSKVECCCHYSQ